MENTVSTKVVKLDLKTILENYKDPKFWSKKWPIIDTKEIKIVWYIESISCVDNKISSCVMVQNKNIRRGKKKFDYKDSWWSREYQYLSSIPINNPEYTEEHFKKTLLNSIIQLLEQVEQRCTYDYAEYAEAELLEEKIENSLRKIAEAFLDENNVTNEEIRDAYIDKYIEKNSKKHEYVLKVIERYKHKIIPNSYLFVYAWFNKEKEFDEFETKMGHRVSTRMEMWRKVQEIQTEEWENGMKEQLEKI